MPGRVDGRTLRLELACRAEEVLRHVEDETEVELTLNPFQTTAETERIDVATLPSLLPDDVRREWGFYGDDVALLWLAGRARRVDGRWERLDRSLRDLVAQSN